jgi:hypothetical protein
MVFAIVAPSVLSPMPMIRASTPVLFAIHTTLPLRDLLLPCLLGSMSTTLSISPKIPRWNHSSNAF